MGGGSPREQAPATAAPMHSTVNWALLGLIIERPSYAYELAARFERTYDGAIALSSVSHVYTALAALRERGLIRELAGQRETVRSRRRYQATEEGVNEHAQWLVGQVDEERRRQRVLMVQLGALAKDPAQAAAALDAYENACLQELASAPAHDADRGPGTTRLVARLTGEERRLVIAARIQWVQYARTQLQAQPSGGQHAG